jgi:L-ascorbate metabolism protein UlaG (beta-lactamase superfamily)
LEQHAMNRGIQEGRGEGTVRQFLDPQSTDRRTDRMRRRLLLLALGAATLATVPRTVWAQSGDPESFSRTMRSLRNWWQNLTREPDEGDEEAKDTTRFVWPERPDPGRWESGGITLTWIGHATFLINLEGTIILTDPSFNDRVGIGLLGLTTIGPKRLVPPALRIADLPKIDLLLLSHAHHDHFDIPSLRRLPKDIPVVLARDTTEFTWGIEFHQMQELDWRQTAEVGGVRIEALPVKHWGRRYPWDRDRGYNGLLLTKNGRSVLFGGDTAHTNRLPASVGERSIDVALLPIGAYNPYIHNHADPEQAWDLANRIGARYLVPMHWRTFRLSRERPFEPFERLAAAAGDSADRIALHSVGETWRLPG